MKALKWIGILVGVIVLVIVAAAIIIPMVVNPNDYKDDIAAAVEKATGRTLDIKGDLGLSVWPSLTLDLGEATLSNPPGFGDAPFAQIQSAKVSVRLMPLLDKKVDADQISLIGLALDLQVDADGRNNWDDLAGGGGETADADTGTAQGGEGAGLAALAIGGINVKDARLAYDDRAGGQKLAIEGLNLSTGAIELREPIDVEAGFRLVAAKPQVNADVSLATTLELDLVAKRYRAQGLKLGVRLDSKEFGVAESDLKLVGEVLADLGANVVSVSDLQLDLGSALSAPAVTSTVSLRGGAMLRTDTQVLRGEGTVLEFDAKGAGLGLGDDGHASGRLTTDLGADLTARRFDLSALKLALDAAGAALPGGKADAQLSGNASVDLGKDSARVSDLIFEGMNLYLTGAVDVAGLQSTPVASGHVELAEFSPRKLLQALAVAMPETADPAVLNKAAATLDFKASQRDVSLSKLALRLDDSRIDGRLALAGLGQRDIPAATFRLDIDAIDVDRYMPPAGAADDAATAKPKAAKSGAGGARAAQPVAIPLDLVRQLDLDGVLKVGKFKINNLRSEQVELTVKAKNGMLDIDPFQARMYEGSGTVSLRVDARQDTGKYRAKQALDKVQIGPLLKDLTGDDKIHGTATIDGDLTSEGNDPDALTRALNGTVAFQVADGAVKGVNIGKLIRDARAMLKGGASSADDEPEQTDFSALSGTAKIKKGVLTNDDLQAKSPLLRVEGNGTVNLVEQTQDYLVRTVIVETSKGQGGKDLEELKGLPIPVRVTGSFSDPKYKVDLGKVLEGKAKEKLKQKLKDKLEQKLGGGDTGGGSTEDALKNQLKGLFSR